MSTHKSDDLIDDLQSIRDWLRYAVSAFTRADLHFGHGSSTAIDEAAFLILERLKLPIDAIDPWLDCRLTRAERADLRDLVSRRIETRKPAAYLVNAAYIQGQKFYVDERVIVPRSFIGELLATDALAGVTPAPEDVGAALDLCTGSGCLAILMAEAFPLARVDAIDISADALDVARKNIADYQLEDRVEIIKSDLFAGVAGRRYDVIISNPPYVTSAAVAAFPPEHRAEPKLAHESGDTGLDATLRFLDQASEHLTDAGVLIVEIGQAKAALEQARPDLPFLWLDTETSEGEVFALRAEDLKSGKRKGARRT